MVHLSHGDISQIPFLPQPWLHKKDLHRREGSGHFLAMLWLLESKNWFIWKDPDSGKDWRQEEKGTTEDEMVGWHHQLDGHEFQQALRVGDRETWRAAVHGVANSRTRLNWTELEGVTDPSAPGPGPHVSRTWHSSPVKIFALFIWLWGMPVVTP